MSKTETKAPGDLEFLMNDSGRIAVTTHQRMIDHLYEEDDGGKKYLRRKYRMATDAEIVAYCEETGFKLPDSHPLASKVNTAKAEAALATLQAKASERAAMKSQLEAEVRAKIEQELQPGLDAMAEENAQLKARLDALEAASKTQGPKPAVEVPVGPPAPTNPKAK